MGTKKMHSIQGILGDIYEVRSYSGRGMYGETCLGVVLQTTKNDPIAVVAGSIMEYILDGGWGPEEVAGVAEAMVSARSDSLGRGHIVYFPGVSFVKTGGDE